VILTACQDAAFSASTGIPIRRRREAEKLTNTR
jgi:hypothetical protein